MFDTSVNDPPHGVHVRRVYFNMTAIVFLLSPCSSVRFLFFYTISRDPADNNRMDFARSARFSCVLIYIFIHFYKTYGGNP